jgi:hypothetical protein
MKIITKLGRAYHSGKADQFVIQAMFTLKYSPIALKEE